MVLEHMCYELNTKKLNDWVCDYVVFITTMTWSTQETTKSYLLALRTFHLIQGRILRLVVGGTAQDSDPLLTLLLCYSQLVNVPFHISGPQKISFHCSSFFTLNEMDR